MPDVAASYGTHFDFLRSMGIVTYNLILSISKVLYIHQTFTDYVPILIYQHDRLHKSRHMLTYPFAFYLCLYYIKYISEK